MTQILDVLDQNDAQLRQEFEAALANNAQVRAAALDGIKQQTAYSKQHQAQLKRQAEQEQAQTGYTEYASLLQTQLNELANKIAEERAEMQYALDLAAAAASWQHAQPGHMAAIIKQFAMGAAQFRPMASSDQEFTKILFDTVIAATSGLESNWQLRVESNLAKALRIFGAGWTQHMIGDQRANAISNGLKAAKATGGK